MPAARSCLSDGIEVPAIALTYCPFTRECLPPSYRDIDKDRINFDAEAHSPRRLRRDQRGAAAQKRLVDCFSDVAVVEDGTAHALNRLLG